MTDQGTKATSLAEAMQCALFRARTQLDDTIRNKFTTRLKVCQGAYLPANAYFTNRGKHDVNEAEEVLTRMLDCVGDWLGVKVGHILVEMAATHGGADCNSPYELAKAIYPDTSTTEFMLTMLKASGLCAKALESHDHLEAYPCREVLNQNMPILLIGLLACITENTIRHLREKQVAYVNPLFTAGWSEL